MSTVSKNKGGFSKRQIKDNVKYWEIQRTLGFWTVKKVKFIIRIKHIQDCQVEIEDVEKFKNDLGGIRTLFEREYYPE